MFGVAAGTEVYHNEWLSSQEPGYLSHSLKDRDESLGSCPSGRCQLSAVLFEEARVVSSLGTW